MNNYTPTDLVQQVKEDYMSYAMSVLIGRSIPSLSDGCKPAARRVLTAMKWLGLKPEGRYVKSSRIEGDVMGKLHPHGSSYGTIVTLAAPYNNNLPLIDGQGNYGSSTDNPASSRYTEAKLSPFAWDAVVSDEHTWEMISNYDGSLQEPYELDVKVPLVLLNGQEGIGVGYATRIAQHNLRDIAACVVSGKTLYPDFNTGCSIVKDEGLENYVKTGIGTMRLRANLETTEEKHRGKDRHILTFVNLPVSTSPEKIGEQIKVGLDKGNIDGIASLVDSSDLGGDRITITTKPGVNVKRVIQSLYHYTDLELKYSARNLVIENQRPVELSSNDIVTKWKTWRLNRLRVQFEHEQDAKMTRLEVVMGLIKAIDKIDLVIKTIRAAASPREALIELVSNRSLKFTSDQARAILEMKLRSLTNLDSDELLTEKQELEARLTQLESLIEDEKDRSKYMIAEIKAIGVRHGETRRSQLIDPPESLAIEKGSSRAAAPVAKPRFMVIDMKKGVVAQGKGPRGALLVDAKDKVILMTNDGILKKVPATFKGPIGTGYSEVVLAKREADVSTRTYLAVFSLDGQLKAMALRGEDLCKTTSKGKWWLPDMAQFVYFGEGTYTVPWVSPRKKKVELFPLTTKMGRPGAKGIKVANIDETHL